MAKKIGTITSGDASAGAMAASSGSALPRGSLSPSEEIKQRYERIERQADALGRVIGVRRLRPSQQVRVQGLSDGMSGDVLGALLLVASVCEIDAAPFPVPKTRAELDAVMDLLDAEGMLAAKLAYIAMHGGDGDGEQEVALAAKK